MISKQDILERAREWKLRPEVVEKDYVLGWVLAAIANHDEASAAWVLKGGTCVKKCFIETYRFSEDLDFSLVPDAAYTEDELREILREVSDIAHDLSRTWRIGFRRRSGIVCGRFCWTIASRRPWRLFSCVRSCSR